MPVRLFRFAAPGPSRSIGLAWRRTSPRKADFEALGAILAEVGTTLTGDRLPAAEPGTIKLIAA
jgi:LysR family hydrogen peroxide-inducible transcriptional activator